MISSIKKKVFVWTIGLCFLILLAFIFAGCSGNTDISGTRAGTGAFFMKVSWPDSINKNDPALHLNHSGRFIPQGAQTIFISITGFGIAPGLPITSSISYPQTSVLIENIPAGAKVATIQALSGTTVLSQRKESFIISNGKTEQAGNIALGVAVKQSGTNIIFEPSYIEVTSGADIPFQNWTTSEITITGVGADLPLSGAYQDGSGAWVFSSGARTITETINAGIQGKNAICNLIVNIKWQKNYGGSTEDWALSIVQTSDGGYAVAGYTGSSASGDVTGQNKGDRDYWILKLNSTGGIVWQKNYGGSSTDYAFSIVQTSDGGYAVAGRTLSSSSGEVTGTNWGSYDCWILKLNSTGGIVWQKNYGGNSADVANSLVHTSDGGYALAGATLSSANGDVTGTNRGASDFWIVKLNSTGGIVWQKNYGGSTNEEARCIIQTSDGGYAAVGTTVSSATGEVTGTNRGGWDFWILKLNSTGGIVWQKNYGGSSNEYTYSIVQTFDGGYTVAGYTESSASGEVTGTNRGDGDYWILKLNSTGGIVWQKNYGGSSNDWACSIVQTSDGGYAVAGYTWSSANGDVTGMSKGGYDYWILKLNSTGGIVWQKNYGGNSNDEARSIVHTSDGGYAAAGYTESSADGDVTGQSRGGKDYWIVKIDANSALQ